MTQLKQYYFNNKPFYIAKDVKKVTPLYFYGTSTCIRKIIEKRNIPPDHYAYGTKRWNGRYNPSTGLNKATLFLSSEWTHKYILTNVNKPKLTPPHQMKLRKTIIDTKPDRHRNEVQSHGFCWERDIIRNVYGVSDEELKTVNYTNKVDLPALLNRIGKFDLSIKTSCNTKSVCMADCLRIYDVVNNEMQPYHMVVIQYTQCGSNKKVNRIIEIDLTSSVELLFGSIRREQLVELINIVKSVPQKRKPTMEEHNRMYEYRNKLQALSGAIHLDIKCNSTQSRVQCSFNHFDDFLKNNTSRIITQSSSNHYRGGMISHEIQSGQRVFKKTHVPK
jgi:hypothetical protein